jgi:hypothetical protein
MTLSTQAPLRQARSGADELAPMPGRVLIVVLSRADHIARKIAANGIRPVLDEHRTTETPTLKSGQHCTRRR